MSPPDILTANNFTFQLKLQQFYQRYRQFRENRAGLCWSKNCKNCPSWSKALRCLNVRVSGYRRANLTLPRQLAHPRLHACAIANAPLRQSARHWERAKPAEPAGPFGLATRRLTLKPQETKWLCKKVKSLETTNVELSTVGFTKEFDYTVVIPEGTAWSFYELRQCYALR